MNFVSGKVSLRAIYSNSSRRERRAMAKQSHPKDESPTALPSDSLVPLESILCTEELDRRPLRPPDYETETRALAALVQALADSPRTILQTLADKILEVFKAGSAGISLLTKGDGGKRFYWPAIAGVWKPHIGGGTPRDFGPCGDVLDRNAALLFRHFERRYTYFLPVTPPVEECLLVPFYVEGKAVGTIWAITHDERRKFDAEDLRQLESLGRFASAAYQATEFLDALEQRGEALGQSHTELARRMAELQKTNTEAQNSRRAALNLMEDAVQSRQVMERLNAELRESEERLARELTATQQLQSASALLIEGGDTHALYQKIVDAAVAIMHSDCASMQILDEGEDALRMLAWTGFDPEFAKIFALNGPDTKTSRSAARVIVPDVETCDFIVGTPALADHHKTGIRAVQSTPLFSRGGRLLGVLSTHWRTPHAPAESDLRQFDILARQAADLMERKQAEDTLRRAMEFDEAVMSNMGEGLYTVDNQGQVTMMNPAAEKLLGWTLEELRGKKMHDVTHYKHPDSSPFPAEECTGLQVLREGKALKDFEDTFIRKDGRLFPVSYSSSPLRDRDGEIVGLVVVFQDITERNQAQEALRQNQAQLENRVAERTTELQQVNAALSRDMQERKKLEEQLLQAQKMESIGVLAGGIAHDFNNILNIIQGYAFILRGHGTQDKEIGESLTVIDETVHRGSALVQQLLTLARKSTTKVESVNVNGLVEGLIPLITQTFPKTIELSRALEADLPPITADKNQIEQALLNLCVNARDAMSDAGRLSFKTQSIEGATLQGFGETLGGRYVCIEVSDTGVGMDESVQKRIFEPFFTTKNTGQGTGLGLSVVYGIVKNHNGFINVESKPESGTSFRLYFPVAQSLEKPATDEITEASFETTQRPNGHGTILLVEDEKNMLDLLEKILVRHGYRVLAAADGETALNIYRRSKEAIDVVLLDIGLPKMAGRDVLLNIKNENPDVKVIIASGYLEPQLKSEIDKAGVKYFLSKPYRPDEVVRTLQSLIEGKS
jgi:PAS domain S-box-containing protein